MGAEKLSDIVKVDSTRSVDDKMRFGKISKSFAFFEIVNRGCSSLLIC